MSTEKKSTDEPVQKGSSMIWEKVLRFADHGGYRITLNYRPATRLNKILHALRIIKPKDFVVEYQDNPLDGEYAQIFKRSRDSIAAVFRATKGTGKLIVSVPKETVEQYDFSMEIERLPS